MARLAQIVMPGVAHHVAQRGNNKQDGFFVEDDKRVNLDLLREQNLFNSCPMDEERTFNALCYVELNPVRAGMVRRPWRYPCSSAAAHCGKVLSNSLLDLTSWRETIRPEDWIETLATCAEDVNATNAIRRSTRTGRPLGCDSFPSKLETALNRTKYNYSWNHLRDTLLFNRFFPLSFASSKIPGDAWNLPSRRGWRFQTLVTRA